MPAATSSGVTRFSTASSLDDFETQLGSRKSSMSCWRRVVSPGDPVVLCCAVIFGAFIFLSTVIRSSVDPGGSGSAAALPKGPAGGPEGFVAVERKVYRKEATAENAAEGSKGLGEEAAATQEAKSVEMQGEVNVLQDRIKTEKQRLRLLKKREKQLAKEEALMHVDHAKQQVLQERNLLDKEEKFERKEENQVKKEKNIVAHLRKDLNAEERLLNHLDKDGNLKKAENLDKDERHLEKAEKKHAAKFNKVHEKELKKDRQVQEVADTWQEIKTKYGVSKNIDFKHTKEEKRHSKIRKKAAAAVDKFNKLEAQHEELLKKEAELQRRLHEAEAAAGTGL